MARHTNATLLLYNGANINSHSIDRKHPEEVLPFRRISCFFIVQAAVKMISRHQPTTPQVKNFFIILAVLTK